MTLDEARRCLDVASGASGDEIREAFRRRAREVHPDRYPGIGPADRKRLEADFDRVREARDILLRYTFDPLRTPPPTAPTSPSEPVPSSRRAYREQQASGTASAPRVANSGRMTSTWPTGAASGPVHPDSATSEEPPIRRRPAPRVTMRFDEFVAWSDAAGFGAGLRTAFPRDWARVVAWSVVGLCVTVVGTMGIWAPLGT
jgi:hypothetical protein